MRAVVVAAGLSTNAESSRLSDSEVEVEEERVLRLVGRSMVRMPGVCLWLGSR